MPHYRHRTEDRSPSDYKFAEMAYGIHIKKPVTPRTLTREELEEGVVNFRRRQAFQIHHSTVPFFGGYLEPQWRARFSRKYEKERATNDVNDAAKKLTKFTSMRKSKEFQSETLLNRLKSLHLTE
eukprot:TRINITY_DN1178_c6_g1_i1.p1 TRINITY_DN1178_c6_g1~~TRINITY_DN1178_c6_g1_i1.p1  ORF type:complete len:125 (+),score=11.85 TRINITY_DN1178_c6_g1_i1:123-497(+)